MLQNIFIHIKNSHRPIRNRTEIADIIFYRRELLKFLQGVSRRQGCLTNWQGTSTYISARFPIGNSVNSWCTCNTLGQGIYQSMLPACTKSKSFGWMVFKIIPNVGMIWGWCPDDGMTWEWWKDPGKTWRMLSPWSLMRLCSSRVIPRLSSTRFHSEIFPSEAVYSSSR